MALINTDPRDLVAKQFFAPEAKFNILGAIQNEIQVGRERSAIAERDKKFNQGTQAAFQGTASSDEIAQLFASDPEKAKQVMAGAGAFNEAGRRSVANTAFAIQNTPFNQRGPLIQQAAQRVQQSGGDPNRMLSLLQMDESQQDDTLNVFQQAALSVKERTAADLGEREFGLKEQGLGLEGRRVSAQERNVNSQIKQREVDANLRQQVINQAAAKAERAITAGVVLDAKDRQGINKDVTSLIKETVGIHAAAVSLDGLKNRGTAAAKLAAVFKFMKALDPTSVVRESEQGQVYSASGAAAQLAGQLNSVLGQGKLTETGFKDLVNTSKNMANSALDSTSGQVTSYIDTFEDTIPQTFREKVFGRIPQKFSSKKAAQAGTGSGTIGRFTVEVVQ